MTPIQALEAMEEETEFIIGEEVHSFYNRLIATSPVRLGHFKQSWRAPEQKERFKWFLHNSAYYATILASGRYHALGRWYGSIQWENGIVPMIKVTQISIKRRLDNVRY